MTLTLLIDADVFAYQCAASSEVSTRYSDDCWVYHADESMAIAKLNNRMSDLMTKLKADAMIVCLTDKVNWRTAILPTYKGNRKNVRKPLLLNVLKDYYKEHYDTYERPTMEADDILGILQSHPTLVKGDTLIVTIDKDLKTIAGKHYNTDHPDDGVFEVTELEADDWHLVQSLAGDATDGYAGCPTVGLMTAKAFIADPYITYQEISTYKSGPRKGQEKREWKTKPTDDVWKGIVSLYAKVGLTEEDALVQARMARICRHTEYDFKKKEVILWTPNK